MVQVEAPSVVSGIVFFADGDSGCVPLVRLDRYALGVDALESMRLLLIDTCGETAGVAVCVGREVVGSEDLARGGASAEIVAAVRRLLGAAGWKLAEVETVGVVSGPGSFTGMRTGLAAAKGLCEAAGLRLVGVSRLEVLAVAAGAVDGFVALDAGRGTVYVREVVSGREWMCGDGELVALPGETQVPCGNDNQKNKSNDNDKIQGDSNDKSNGSANIHDGNDKSRSDSNDIGGNDGHIDKGNGRVVVAEERVAERLREGVVVVHPLHVRDALGVVLGKVGDGAEDAGLVDANYVRGETDIYRKNVTGLR